MRNVFFFSFKKFLTNVKNDIPEAIHFLMQRDTSRNILHFHTSFIYDIQYIIIRTSRTNVQYLKKKKCTQIGI